jgi:hypothetical protein
VASDPLRPWGQERVQFPQQRSVVSGGARVLALMFLPGSDQEGLDEATRRGLVDEQSPFDPAGSLPKMSQAV